MVNKLGLTVKCCSRSARRLAAGDRTLRNQVIPWTLAIVSVLLWLLTWGGQPVAVRLPFLDQSIAVAPPWFIVPGLLIGFALLIPALQDGLATAVSDHLRAVFGAAAIVALLVGLLWAVRLNQIPPFKAGLIGFLGAITLWLAMACYALIRRNNGLTFESHWGGLGGGLGGWRASPALVVAILTLLFASATVGVALYEPGRQAAAKVESKTGKSGAEVAG